MGMPCSPDLRVDRRRDTLLLQEVIVGKRRIVFGLVGILTLLIAGLTAVGADSEITYTIEDVGDRPDGLREVVVSTPLAEYIFSEEHGTMKSAYLTFAPYGTEPTELVPGSSRNDDNDLLLIQSMNFPFSLTAGELVDGDYEIDTERSGEVEPGVVQVVLMGMLGDLAITKRFTIRADAIYTIDVELLAENGTGEPVDLSMLLGGSIDEGDYDLYFLFDDERGEDLLATGSYFSFDGLGAMNKTNVLFLSPSEGTLATPLLQGTPAGNREFGVRLKIPAGSSSHSFSLYGGRRRFLLMKDAGLAELDQPGVVARLMIPVIQFLEWLYRATGNYGWAIILFTILTRLILFPLMRKQYHSMAKMQQIQPKLKRIQERFKDDRQIQQQKLMELYKKEGVNPMSGCLPLLVQLPILILIWRAILYSSESIHLSPGFLWIPDLSVADPYFILVIVTTGIMMLQQWLMGGTTQAQATGTQKYFGYIFPIIMAVLLWRFPAGLWLYYLLTTATQVAQQWIVNREMAAAGHGRLTIEEPAIDIDSEDISADDADGTETGDGDGGSEGRG